MSLQTLVHPFAHIPTRIFLWLMSPRWDDLELQGLPHAQPQCVCVHTCVCLHKCVFACVHEETSDR